MWSYSKVLLLGLMLIILLYVSVLHTNRVSPKPINRVIFVANVSSSTTVTTSTVLPTLPTLPSLKELDLPGVDLLDEVTLVTAYFDIGSFSKGSPENVYTPQMYKDWMQTFARINNSVIAYFDDERNGKLFTEIRASLPASRTRIFILKRSELWAFSLRNNIKEIIKSPEYPKHYPNTLHPDYGCIMHAKYEIMAQASIQNYYRTKYIAWVDIGEFRMYHLTDPYFWIYIPPDFDAGSVAYGEVQEMKNVTPSDIFLGNYVWVCGCYFIATTDVMYAWTKEYIQYVERYFQQGLTNTDQQVVYAMQRDQLKPRTGFVAYKRPSTGYNKWFFLGQMCKEEGWKKYIAPHRKRPS